MSTRIRRVEAFGTCADPACGRRRPLRQLETVVDEDGEIRRVCPGCDA